MTPCHKQLLTKVNNQSISYYIHHTKDTPFIVQYGFPAQSCCWSRSCRKQLGDRSRIWTDWVHGPSQRSSQTFQRRTEGVGETYNNRSLYPEVSWAGPADIGVVYRTKKSRWANNLSFYERRRDQVICNRKVVGSSEHAREFDFQCLGTGASYWSDTDSIITIKQRLSTLRSTWILRKNILNLRALLFAWIVLRWVHEAWREIPAGMVMKSFKTCGFSNALDGTEDDELFTEDRRRRSWIQRVWNWQRGRRRCWWRVNCLSIESSLINGSFRNHQFY